MRKNEDEEFEYYDELVTPTTQTIFHHRTLRALIVSVLIFLFSSIGYYTFWVIQNLYPTVPLYEVITQSNSTGFQQQLTMGEVLSGSVSRCWCNLNDFTNFWLFFPHYMAAYGDLTLIHVTFFTVLTTVSVLVFLLCNWRWNRILELPNS